MADQPRLAIESIAGLRPYQEDAVLAETLEDGRVLVAVADGMGGHAAGEIASAIALETLVEAIQEGHTLAEAFTLANERVHDRAREPGKKGMGTTLVAALVDGDGIHLANVGDSRGYRISQGRIERLTQDHSFVAEAVKRGQSEAVAMAGPWKDALTRSIGTEAEVEVDTFGPLAIDDDSALLVCSDGLYKTLSDDELLRIYSRSSSPRGAAQALVANALERGSDDNISVAIAEYGEVRRAAAGGTMPLEALPPKAKPANDPITPRSPVTAADSRAERTGPAIAVASAPADSPAAAGYPDDDSSTVPIGAITAVVVVVGALLALLAFGG